MDEQELVRQVQEGNEMAFAKIMSMYKDRIVNYLCQFIGDYQRAVELAQETFLRVYFKANKYKPVAPFSSWIFAIASNLAKTEMRKMRKLSFVSFDDMPRDLQAGTFIADTPDSGLIKNLRQALASLHSRYRIPVVLKDIEGFSQEEIAQILKKPIGTVKARISRGRNYLKREMEKALKDKSSSPKNEESVYGRV